MLCFIVHIVYVFLLNVMIGDGAAHASSNDAAAANAIAATDADAVQISVGLTTTPAIPKIRKLYYI